MTPLPAPAPSGEMPVTVLTGYLGAGKTTLLNRILTQAHGRKFAVIVNEFGELGVDHDLVVHTDGQMFQMNNGCLCCTVQGDLARILGGLLRRNDEFEGIIVETTGLADLAPVAQTFFLEPEVSRKTLLDAVVTVVDAHSIEARLLDSPEAAEQIAFADVILLNKLDLVSPDQDGRIEARIRQMNGAAHLVRTRHCEVDLADVLGRGGFNLDHILTIDPEFLQHRHAHEHDDAISSVSFSADRPLNAERVERWLDEVAFRHGPSLLRWKGILNLEGVDERVVFQGVNMILEVQRQRSWAIGEPRASRAVFIGRDLPRDRLRAGFEACLAS